jgi:dinuclear metal center YbgI/SA1388 family protein
MKIIDVINEILKISPLELQHDYDNSGLQVGDAGQKLKNILVTLDVSTEVLKKAEKNGVNLVLSHHPLIFRALKKIDTKDAAGKKIISAIKNDICIYTSHTNFDSVSGGLNDFLGSLLDIDNLTPLVEHEDSSMLKLVVFVPLGYESKIKRALFSIGAGIIGDYTGCSFSQSGEGSFTAPESARPFTGSKGCSNVAEETRIEMVVPRRLIDKAVNEIIKVHPYEEPAFDIYPLINRHAGSGMGRVGELKKKMSLAELAGDIKNKLKIKHLRYVGRAAARVKRAALCSGSGGSLINAAINKGADVYITGDIKYHEARQAEEAGINIIDAGHFATEVIFTDCLKNVLSNYLKSKGSAAKVFTHRAADPFITI